ncbi:ABC transporter ATP-binding protein [Sinomonas sp. JGH33]|uniref:ABC transporter ATP-binding protein n=1 Tax=Sinomonas terricola TaxID=3110330 RepID=A0ABU5T716_9MICC|nr:ABC transporter ATP-binding protein [Sinomonas sp. JGH33]MEA5455464.1 ABC transporter ATP-binding protein [Sinomonas sp. JGH33]
MNPAARLSEVSQVFGDFTAVDRLDLDIEAGKLTTLLGPSGCGKTTTLRMLAGYTRPTSGRIEIGGRDATALPPEKRNLGMVFQSYALFPHLSVGENVGYGLKLRKVAGPERRRRVAEALDMVGLGHLGDRKPKALSGGQQQRVALARAIAIQPEILLLDEPLSNLDARLRLQMRSEIRRIQQQTGLTVVLVTHDQEEALEMSDVMVLMRSGKIMQKDTPQEVFERPTDRFVAEFMGYENFFATREHASATVRPENLRLLGHEAALDDGAHGFPAVVTQVAYRGVDLMVRATATDAAGDDVELVAAVRADSGTRLEPGARVTAGIRTADLVPLAG